MERIAKSIAEHWGTICEGNVPHQIMAIVLIALQPSADSNVEVVGQSHSLGGEWEMLHTGSP